MIVSRDIHPERDFYYLGAKVIKLLGQSKADIFDFFEVYTALKKEENISINLFVLTLDWLYLINAITTNQKGDLIKCF